MSKAARTIVLSLAAVIGLVFTTSALAAYRSPILRVESSDVSVGGGGPVTLTVQTSQSDDPTAKVTIYAPLGYRVTLGQRPGTTLGRVNATIIAGALGDARTPLSGTVVVDDPAKHVGNQCAPGNHQGVWLLQLAASGQTVTVPAYVDEVTTGPEAAYASSKIQVCLNPPQTAQLQAKLISAAIGLRGVYSNPAVRGVHTWRALFTPYLTIAGPINPPATVEARAQVRLPAQLSLRPTLNRRTGWVTVRGALTAGTAGIAGERVRVLRGVTARGVRTFKVVRTNARGQYSSRFRMQPGWTRFVRGYVTVPARLNTADGCTGTSIAPAGCVSSTLMGFDLYSPRVQRLARAR
jgi:hypothetical protein